MKALNEILEVYSQAADTLILKVKDGSQLDLITNGFGGNETLFRLYSENGDKWGACEYTPFVENYKPGYTYHWGRGGTTMASESFTRQRDKVVACARKYFNFSI